MALDAFLQNLGLGALGGLFAGAALLIWAHRCCWNRIDRTVGHVQYEPMT